MNQNNNAFEHALRRYQAVLAAQIYGIILINENSCCELVNQKLCDMFHISFAPSELVGLTSEDILRLTLPACADPEGSLALIRDILAMSRKHVGREILMADGRTLLGDFIPIIIDDKPSGRMWQFRDITHLKQTEALLESKKQRLAYILEGTDVGTWEWNVQTGETMFNERWAGMVGYTLEDLAPVSIDTWIKLTHPDDLEMSRSLLEKHFNRELPFYVHEARMRHKKGHWVWILDRGKVATWTDDGKPLMMCGTHMDITERKMAEEKILHLATHDVLTGLPSLRLVRDRLAMSLGMSRRNDTLTAVMFVDLDRFKEVNDTFGHDAGDYVLTVVADRLLSSVRETDTVARIGGDEFLIIATDLQSGNDAALIAEKISRLVSRPVALYGRHTTVVASIGIALYPDNGEDMDNIIKLADRAMYKIKNSGGDGYCFARDAIE
jgi:diguanylate cyclase (GGDEF)-like protein/PAS domain S-box-containing protein